MSQWFDRFATRVALLSGEARTFVLAVVLIVGWAVNGPLFDFSDTWQLMVNTTTTIITFLMVFIIQHTQNRTDSAIHVKLDEILRALDKADNRLVGVEHDAGQ